MKLMRQIVSRFCLAYRLVNFPSLISLNRRVMLEVIVTFIGLLGSVKLLEFYFSSQLITQMTIGYQNISRANTSVP